MSEKNINQSNDQPASAEVTMPNSDNVQVNEQVEQSSQQFHQAEGDQKPIFACTYRCLSLQLEIAAVRIDASEMLYKRWIYRLVSRRDREQPLDAIGLLLKPQARVIARNHKRHVL